MKKIADLGADLSTISRWRFRIIAVSVSLFFIAAGFLITRHLSENQKILDIYKNLPTELKDIISVNGYWIELLLNSLVPMFIFFSFHYYSINQRPKVKAFIYKALPFLPYLNWLAVKPLMLFVGTSGIFLGTVLCMTYYGGKAYAWLLFIPLSMYFCTYILRRMSVAIENHENLTQFELKNNRKIAALFLALAVLFWFLNTVVLYFFNLYDVYQYLWVAIK